MTRMRQILLTALLVLTAISAGLLVGCEGRQRFGFGGGYYSSSDRMYPSSTYYQGKLYYPGSISRIHSRSYPSSPLVIRRGYRVGGYYRPYTSPYTRPYTRPHTSRRTPHYRPSGHSTGHGSTGHGSSSYRSGSYRSSGRSSSGHGSSGHGSSGRSGHR